MKLEHITPQEFRRQVLPIMQKHLNLNEYKVFLFGSRVTGKNSDRSDIDIGIDGPTAIPPTQFSNIQEEIDALPILYKIDVVDFKKVSPEFREVALHYTEPL